MMKADIITKIEQDIKNLKLKAVRQNVGLVTEVGDGVAKIEGLSDVQYSELLDFGKEVFGLALNLEQYSVGAVIFGDFTSVKEGDLVKTTGKILQVPVGEALVGRVVNALGIPIDGKGPIKAKISYPVEKIAPGVITRQSVNTPLQTGIKAIDTMIPIGRGQRELIIGDRGLGKTAIVIDTIINQRPVEGKPTKDTVICIYVAIGQKQSSIAQVISRLKDENAFDYTI